MRDDKDHNERLDDFSGYMRQRLEEHRLPVDAGCWDEVEARMNRKARSRGWLWTGGLAAAAVLALVIWLLPSPEKMPLEELSPFQKEISEKAEEMNILPERPVLPVEPVKKRIAKVLKWGKRAKPSAIVWEKETIRKDERRETIEIIEKDAIAAIVEEPSVKEDASEDSTDIVVKRGDSTVPLPEGERSPRRKASLKKKAKKSKRNKWLLAAAVGSSGYVDSFLNTDMSYGDASSPGDMNNSGRKTPIRISRIKTMMKRRVVIRLPKRSHSVMPRYYGVLRWMRTSWIIVRSNLIRTLATPFRYHSVLRYGRI